MKKICFILFFGVTVISKLNAQNDSTAQLDLLKAPTSPGFILLDNEPSDIERPTNTTDFMVGLRNATDNFSSLPKNYSVELSPFWLLGAKKITFEKLTSDSFNFFENFRQSFTISTAIVSDDDAVNPDTRVAFGAKFSIVRGKVSEEFRKANAERLNVLSKIGSAMSENAGVSDINKKYGDLIRATDNQIRDSIRLLNNTSDANRQIEIRANIAAMRQKEDFLALQQQTDLNHYKDSLIVSKDNSLTEYDEKLKQLSETKLERKGLALDAAGGFVTDFPNQVFDQATVVKYGAWLTLSHEGMKNFSFLIVARELFQKEESYTDENDNILIADLHHTDGGIRFILDKDKFSFSLEALGRMTGGGDHIKKENKSAWKLLLNASYDLGNNKIITFNFGRDFDGTVNKDGNLIAALNLVLGFGSKRKIND